MKIDIQWLISTVPIVQLKNIENNEVYSLLEKYNIVGSVKVKTVYWILKDAYEKWLLKSDEIVLEASSWNTAIALAYLGNILKLKVHIILPKTTSPSKKKLITSYGAEIIEIDGTTDIGIKLRDQMDKDTPWKYFLPDQFKNYANFNAHYNLTWPYILQKLWKIDFFVAGLWTSGTLLWAGKYLKEHFPEMKIIWINPLNKIEWLRNFKATDVVIPFYEEHKWIIDEIIDVTFEGGVIQGVKSYLLEWYFVGISSWAILSGAQKYLKNKTGLRWVIIAPDGGDFYLDTLMPYFGKEDFVSQILS